MRLLYLGAVHLDYTRHCILLHGLEQLGHHVVPCFISPQQNAVNLHRKLIAKLRRLNLEFDVVLLAEFNHLMVPLAKWIARRARCPLVYDCLGSVFDMSVYDRRTTGVISARAAAMRLLDLIALHIPDHVLTDTDAHRHYYHELTHIPLHKMSVVPLGFDDRVFKRARPTRLSDKRAYMKVVFYGSYIPSHGVAYVIRAAMQLPEHEFELIGQGQTLADSQALATSLGAKNVKFSPPVPFESLPAVMADADILLGVFGDTPKAMRAIPNKLFQSLASGRPFVTGDSPALHEFFRPGIHLHACSMADATALAESIRALCDNPRMRRDLAEQGMQYTRLHFNPNALGELLESVLYAV